MILNFKKKCAYCGEKIENGNEIFKEVKTPVFVNPKKKSFCSVEHIRLYNNYVKGLPVVCSSCGLR